MSKNASTLTIKFTHLQDQARFDPVTVTKFTAGNGRIVFNIGRNKYRIAGKFEYDRGFVFCQVPGHSQRVR